MTSPIYQILRSHLSLFLLVTCLTFLVLAIVIFMLPAQTTIRSSIEIGSTSILDSQFSLATPENMARGIPSIFVPAALSAMAGKGVSPLVLDALRHPSVESIGDSVVIASTVSPSIQKEAKEFQETIADLIIKKLAPRERALREQIATQLTLSSKILDNLEQQIKDKASELERLEAIAGDLNGQVQRQQQTLTALYQHVGNAPQSGELVLLEAQIRELQERISSQTDLMNKLTLEQLRLRTDFAASILRRDSQSEAVAQAQFGKSNLIETHVLLPPTIATSSSGSKRDLFLVALIVSLMTGFGTVVMFHNMGAKRN
jgi:hypothetical protein